MVSESFQWPRLYSKIHEEEDFMFNWYCIAFKKGYVRKML
jgi:hypothetical protein